MCHRRLAIVYAFFAAMFAGGRIVARLLRAYDWFIGDAWLYAVVGVAALWAVNSREQRLQRAALLLVVVAAALLLTADPFDLSDSVREWAGESAGHLGALHFLVDGMMVIVLPTQLAVVWLVNALFRLRSGFGADHEPSGDVQRSRQYTIRDVAVLTAGIAILAGTAHYLASVSDWAAIARATWIEPRLTSIYCAFGGHYAVVTVVASWSVGLVRHWTWQIAIAISASSLSFGVAMAVSHVVLSSMFFTVWSRWDFWGEWFDAALIPLLVVAVGVKTLEWLTGEAIGVRPERPQQNSPGQRPGNRSTATSQKP